MMGASIRALALQFPRRFMPNAHWRLHHPDQLATAERSAGGQVWTPQPGSSLRFDQAMAPYIQDPFRGVQRRRWLQEGELPLEMEVSAALKALAAADLAPSDIDLCVVGSFFPNELATGNAPFLAQALGLQGGAINLESACSSSLAGLAVAHALVDAGQAKRVLLVSSCSYSRYAPASNTISWSNGDGAAAYIVDADGDGAMLASANHHTGATCGAVRLALTNDGEIVMEADRSANKLLREAAESMLRTCVDDALHRAGLAVDDVDHFVLNTPTAWFADFACDALGVDRNKATCMHAEFANTGPVLNPTNLYFALKREQVRPGSIVVCYSIGSVSSAHAMVLRMGHVRLGTEPVEIPSDLEPGGLLPNDYVQLR